MSSQEEITKQQYYTIINPVVLGSSLSSSLSYTNVCNAASTIKAMWVTLQQQQQQHDDATNTSSLVIKGRCSSSSKNTYLEISTNKTTTTTNISNNNIITIPGHINSNCIAYALYHNDPKQKQQNRQHEQFVVEQCYIDDYCEYEQNTLQHSLYYDIIIPILSKSNNNMESSTQKNIIDKDMKTKLTSICQRLETTLQQQGDVSGSYYVLHSTMTLVDIVIVTTVWQFVQYYYDITNTNTLDEDNSDISKYETILQEIFTKPIQKYLKFHYNSYNKAYIYAKQIQDEATISSGTTGPTSISHDIDSIFKGTPSFMKVVDIVFRTAIEHVFSNYMNTIVLPKIIVKPCSNPKHGDYQFSAAMPIYASISKASTTTTNTDQPVYNGPIDVANAIVQYLGTQHPIVTDITTQGPGFILCRLSIPYLQYHMNQYLFTNKLCMPTPTIGTATSSNDTIKTSDEPYICVVDFSSPNIAKEMHVGHLRSTIIGECICRILEAMPNYIVHRVNHVGDWGTQFGMLIQYLKEEYPHVVNMNTTEEGGDDAEKNSNKDLPNITDLTQFYKNAKQRFDDNPDFKKISQLNVVKLQSGDPECLFIWKLLCDISRIEFHKVYKRLDVSCVECGESFYNDKISKVIDEFNAANMIQIEEGGAKCVFVPKFNIPLMLQKSDGGYGYDSTDMAALQYRLHELKANRVIYITDFTQGDHFKMVFLAGEKIGWINNGQQLQHIGFGTVQGEDGKRFKTRSGDTVRLVDLLDEAVIRMESELRGRIEEGKANITLDELHEVAEAIGYGAVKYFDLRRNPTSNYKFSYDQMLDTKGDTAVYLLYTRVRLESIVAKAAVEHNVVVDELIKNNVSISMTHACERNLALQLLNFTDVMETTLEDLYPYHICEYVYKVATAASDFVTQCRVLGSDEMESRILLCYVTTNAMRYCFDLLGIRHVKRI